MGIPLSFAHVRTSGGTRSPTHTTWPAVGRTTAAGGMFALPTRVTRRASFGRRAAGEPAPSTGVAVPSTQVNSHGSESATIAKLMFTSDPCSSCEKSSGVLVSENKIALVPVTALTPVQILIAELASKNPNKYLSGFSGITTVSLPENATRVTFGNPYVNRNCLGVIRSYPFKSARSEPR